MPDSKLIVNVLLKLHVLKPNSALYCVILFYQTQTNSIFDYRIHVFECMYSV